MRNQDFINELYLSLLDRLPDQQGFSAYVSLLGRGKPQIDIVYAVLSSEEFFGKAKNWTVVHRELSRILTGNFRAFTNYAYILECIANGERLPPKQRDISKVKSKKFVLLDTCLVHFSKIIRNFGIVIELIEIEARAPEATGFGGDLRFEIDGLTVIPTRSGLKYYLCAPINLESSIQIFYKDRSYFSNQLQHLELKERDGKATVAIVGRFENTTSIGALSLTFLHQLHEDFNCMLIDTRPGESRWNSIGEHISTLRSKESAVSGVDVAIYTDVFSNSLSDINYTKVPEAEIKIAYVVFDSTRLPSWWVDSLNTSFDAVITTSNWGKQMIQNSGVNVPVFKLPLSLDQSYFDSKSLRKEANGKFRFGSIASFSHRKNTMQLVSCFIDCFGDRDDVELVIHTPLSFGTNYPEVLELIKHHNVSNVVISHEELSEYNYASLINSFDVYVLISKGECYSITPRQAFALGKPAIISAGHAHDEMIATGLFLSVNVAGYETAKYEAFEGQEIGLQCFYNNADVSHALRTAYYKFTAVSAGSSERMAYASSFAHEKLRYFYINIVAPKNAFLGDADEILKEGIVVTSRALHQKYGRIRSIQAHSPASAYKFQKIVVPLHDGGFFSVFNTFISHFVWNFGRPDVAAVIPDWRISTLRTYRSVVKPMSFCYGTEADGNIFTKLFLPIPEMKIPVGNYENDEFLKTNTVYYDNYNEVNEPLLTYVHARELYKSAEFPEWRRRYGRFYKKYFRLKDSLRTQIDLILFNEFSSVYVIGVHIKHPSHAIEQPDGFMPGVSSFIRKILDVAQARNLATYKVFLATDQESVVQTLGAIFGDRLIFRRDVARTTIAEDARYKSLSTEAQMQEGHQIQNLRAADQGCWSVKMAEDVLIDAHLLAHCNLFVHVTSNIATAVSYINPEIEMAYCE